MIAEGNRHLAIAGRQAVRRIEPLRLVDLRAGVAIEVDAERARQNQFVGRHPLEPGLRDERDHGVGHRPFRRPQADRPAAEQPLVAGGRPLELFARVFRVLKAMAWHRRVRVRVLVNLRVAQQRKNRVVKRRRRNLDLARLGATSMRRDDGIEDFQLNRPEERLVVLREVASFLNQPFHTLIAQQVERVDPRQLLPDLQVAEVVC